MAADDTRLIAQLVVGRRVHCVGDESVMALAKRVLELEAECLAAIKFAAWAEREACAKAAEEVASSRGESRRSIGVKVAEVIRARGGQPSTIVGVSEGNDGQG